MIADNDPEDQEKAIKYSDLVANAVSLQNVIDQSRILYELKAEGHSVKRANLERFAIALTRRRLRRGL